MANPSVEVIEGEWTGRVVPIYPQSEKAGISSMEIGACIDEALRWVGELDDPVPAEALQEHGFAGRSWSIVEVHRPASLGGKTEARRRLGFDELLRLQLVLVMRKRAVERDCQGIAHNVGSELIESFREKLPFPLTGAQKRAIAEIEADLAKPVPMHRLLQGDVGAGKTLVALWCLLTAVAGGYQGALMAPTEVLAEQHLISLKSMLAGLSVPDDGSLWGQRDGTGGTAHQPHHRERPGQFARWPSRRRHRSRRRYARPADRVRYLSPAGRSGNRRTAPFRGRAEVGAAGEVGRACARRAGNDGHPDTEDGGHDCLWGPRHHGPGRAAPGAYAGRDRMGTRPAGRGSGLADGSRRDRRRPPGLRGVPLSGRVRTGPGQLRQ